jgi:hypothetical protein
MRTDEKGNECPETLGEYRDLVYSLVRDDKNGAVKFLDNKIEESPNGREEVVLAADSQMRYLLFNMMTSGFKR